MHHAAVLKSGKFKGRKLIDVPMEYLLWASGEVNSSRVPFGDLANQIKAELKTRRFILSEAVRKAHVYEVDYVSYAGTSRANSLVHEAIASNRSSPEYTSDDLPTLALTGEELEKVMDQAKVFTDIIEQIALSLRRVGL